MDIQVPAQAGASSLAPPYTLKAKVSLVLSLVVQYPIFQGVEVLRLFHLPVWPWCLSLVLYWGGSTFRNIIVDSGKHLQLLEHTCLSTSAQTLVCM